MTFPVTSPCNLLILIMAVLVRFDISTFGLTLPVSFMPAYPKGMGIAHMYAITYAFTCCLPRCSRTLLSPLPTNILHSYSLQTMSILCSSLTFSHICVPLPLPLAPKQPAPTCPNCLYPALPTLSQNCLTYAFKYVVATTMPASRPTPTSTIHQHLPSALPLPLCYLLHTPAH